MTIRENLVPSLTNTDKFDKLMRNQFYAFTSARNSEQEIICVNPKQGVPAAYADTDYWRASGDDVIVIRKAVAPLPFQNKGGYVAATGSGKIINAGKQCKSQGLTGSEKRACARNVRSVCGRKPMFGRMKKEQWQQCVDTMRVTQEQANQQQSTAEMMAQSQQSQQGMTMGAKVGIAIGVVVVGSVIIYAIAVATKPKAVVTAGTTTGA